MKNRNEGFTVIETLAVLTLSSILMVALMSVLHTIISYQTFFQDKYPDVAWKNRVVTQFREDVINSVQYRLTPDLLELTGDSARNFVTGRATMRPSRVRYFLEMIGDTNWLVREELHLDSGESKRELVCANVLGIQFERLESSTQLGLSRLKNQPAMAMAARIPDRVFVSLVRKVDNLPNVESLMDPTYVDETYGLIQHWNFRVYQR